MKKYVCKVCGYIYDEAAEIRITESSREPNVRIFLRIGSARCVP